MRLAYFLRFRYVESDQLCGRANFLLRVRVMKYYTGMSEPLIIEEGPMDPELERMFEQTRRNLLWFDEHAIELGVFKLYRGRYIAVSEGELFVGDSAEEVERLAREQHPDDVPHVRYIPRKKLDRIYAV